MLAIEPLAEAIRQDPDIKGFQIDQTIHKINLLADDVVIYLTNLYDSLTKLQTLRNAQCFISGYTVNLEKKSNYCFNKL